LIFQVHLLPKVKGESNEQTLTLGLGNNQMAYLAVLIGLLVDQRGENQGGNFEQRTIDIFQRSSDFRNLGSKRPIINTRLIYELLGLNDSSDPELQVRDVDVRLSKMTWEASGYFERGDFAQAARHYQAILDAFPNDPVAKSLLAACGATT